MRTQSRSDRLLLIMVVLALVSCQPTSSGGPAADTSPTTDAAAAYCAQSGGTVEMRYPFYGTSGPDPLQLAGSLQVCTFTAADGSRIFIALDTLYTDQPTLAASAYLAKVPLASGQPSGNPSSFYCTQLGGTDAFGGVNASGGGWANADASDVVALCIFPDLSSIDSWGLTYHSDGTIRGADLTNLLRYKPARAPQVFP